MHASANTENGNLPKIAYVVPRAAGSTSRVSPTAAEKAGSSIPSRTTTVHRKSESLPKVSTKKGSAAGLNVPKAKQSNLLAVTKKNSAGLIIPAAVEIGAVITIIIDVSPAADASVLSAAVVVPESLDSTEVASEHEVLEPPVLPAEVIHPMPIEEVPVRIVNGNGNVKLIYEQYDEMFPIVDGSTTHANIDDVYCLSFVMPDCMIHLSVYDPITMRDLEANGDIDLFLPETLDGTYQTMEADLTYYVYVEQKADQLLRDQEKMKRVAAGMVGAKFQSNPEDRLSKDDGRVIESCSCIYGNPCVDEYGCKDWGSRAKVAMANGWKGF